MASETLDEVADQVQDEKYLRGGDVRVFIEDEDGNVFFIDVTEARYESAYDDDGDALIIPIKRVPD